MQFKVWKDKPEGACGSCAAAIVQKTTHNDMIVFCNKMNKQILEPLEYCQLYREAAVFNVPFPKWMAESAWVPVQIYRSEGTPGYHKTLLPPSDEKLGMIVEMWASWPKVARKKAIVSVGAE